ncbi:sodium:solute symporter family protein [Microaerobacter geothermalis]|uniref:sodium:solute symporter family protein n=1 Tax=Microaerobacter geothermalis TaxID=674972 RepID=UPI001F227311|nr:sodium:solute symporter family protein [Microaerobacter geothermalis]MCF6095069.1 sodium:solute symporter family protein [Microaerobacter geothermalis]
MYDPLLYMGYFILYTIFVLWLGKHGFDRSESIRNYFIANRSLGLLASISTFGATWFSAASMLGLPGLVYAYGYSAFFYSTVSWFLGAVFLIILIDRLYCYDIVTIPEFFLKRYKSPTLQIISGLVLIFSYILYLIIQIRGFGIVVSQLLDIPYSIGVLLVYLFILYTTFGGLHSVARTDIFHFGLIILGSIVAALLIIREVGGIGEILGNVKMFDPYPPEKFSWITFISAFFSLGLGLAANPQYAIRVISAKNKKTAKQMIAYSLAILSIIYLSMMMIGMGTRILIPQIDLASIDEIFPYVLAEYISSPLKGLILISIVGASISTANSQLLLLASSLGYDVIRTLFPRRVGDLKLLGWNKYLIFFLGTVSLFLSFTPPVGLLAFSGQVWGLIAATFFFPLFGGLLDKKATRRGAIASLASGAVVYVFGFFLIPGDWPKLIHPALPAVLAAGFIFWVLREESS